MSGKFKEVKLPHALQEKLKALLEGALTEGHLSTPDQQDLGSPDVPEEFNKAAEAVHNLAEFICNQFPQDGKGERLPKGLEMLMRLIEKASTPGSLRGESLAIAKEYDKEALKEFINVSSVLSQVVIQTLRYLENAMEGDLPTFVVTDGMVTPVFAAKVTDDGDCDCANCKARREGKPPVSIEDILSDMSVTVLKAEPEEDFTGSEGPIRDIAKALRKNKRPPPVS